MRWYIAENKRMTETKDLEGHGEFLEMSGERVSGIVHYAVDGGKLQLSRDIVYPNFRIQPNNTHGSYCIREAGAPALAGEETFDLAQINGTLIFHTHTAAAKIKRIFYPSTTLACFYEDVEVTATADTVLEYEETKRLESTLGCAGYIYVDRTASISAKTVKAGETFRVIFAYTAHFANEPIPTETGALERRMARVDELISEFDLTTGDDVIDTEFAFAKVRAGESIFRTKCGLVHSPGGYSYYAAVWCNDQVEYAAPWFAYTGDEKATEASFNAFRWYEPYMNDDYNPIPSSIIAEGFDYWNGAGDRGDASMYLFGLSRLLLTTGREPDAGQEAALEWCVEYISRKTMDDGAVFSDSDELEGRISSGVNLSTTSLAYGGLEFVAYLWKKYGQGDLAAKATALRERIGKAFEGHFGAELKGYKTYAYHEGCTAIRAWNCLPVYMGVTDRADDTLASIEDTLWNDYSCRTTEGETIMWDRSALYFMSAMFRAGKCDKAAEMLHGYSERRLLGERVPYPVEAYPEGNMRHLSAESALFCRVITDGLLNITTDGKTFSYREKVPFMPGKITVKNAFIGGEYRDIEIG